MSKSQKLAEKIATLKAELRSTKAAEIEAAKAAGRHAIDRAIRTSGLLGLVASGGLSEEALASEFRQVAERLKNSPGGGSNGP